MATQAKAIDQLIHLLGKLPGVGEKTATRLAYYILKRTDRYAEELAAALKELREKVLLCSECQTLTDASPCRLCSDSRRDHTVLCVVEKPSDLQAIERTGRFHGVYFVLHGALSPMDGVGPHDLKLDQLMTRIQANSVQEVILATNPTVEGEATALYIIRHLPALPASVRVTKIASGVPMGGELDYVDQLTLGKALEGRRSVC